MFTYPKPDDTDCVVYSFSVTPHNIVGAGEIATEVYSGDIESKHSIEIDRCFPFRCKAKGRHKSDCVEEAIQCGQIFQLKPPLNLEV